VLTKLDIAIIGVLRGVLENGGADRRCPSYHDFAMDFAVFA
jgi:hypothetical protein